MKTSPDLSFKVREMLFPRPDPHEHRSRKPGLSSSGSSTGTVCLPAGTVVCGAAGCRPCTCTLVVCGLGHLPTRACLHPPGLSTHGRLRTCRCSLIRNLRRCGSPLPMLSTRPSSREEERESARVRVCVCVCMCAFARIDRRAQRVA